MTGKEIQNWSDTAMFKAEEIDEDSGPEVFLLSCNPDPLGSIAAAAKAYKGEFVNSLAEITDDERRYYLAEVQKSVLEMPLEVVQFHFRIKGVTRGFTHQMVRQRTAAYSQESTRFAVKEDVPVGRPPSLDGTMPWIQWFAQCAGELFPGSQEVSSIDTPERMGLIRRYAEERASKAQIWRQRWDRAMGVVEEEYNWLVNDGMPAEDARGMLATNLLTQINYITDLRGLKGHAGVRLCTQAQFEWRLVWAEILKAIREFGKTQIYFNKPTEGWPVSDAYEQLGVSSAWQFDALADIFRPICYYRGSCQFQADFDRHCTIRERVEANAEINRPSSEWDKEYDIVGTMLNVDGYGCRGGDGVARSKATDKPIFIGDIEPREYLLDPAAARVK